MQTERDFPDSPQQPNPDRLADLDLTRSHTIILSLLAELRVKQKC